MWIKKREESESGKWSKKKRWYDCAVDEILGYGEGMNVGWIMVSLSA